MPSHIDAFALGTIRRTGGHDTLKLIIDTGLSQTRGEIPTHVAEHLTTMAADHSGKNPTIPTEDLPAYLTVLRRGAHHAAEADPLTRTMVMAWCDEAEEPGSVLRKRYPEWT